MDELPPPNSSDPVHGGGTISKDEVILFPWGLLEHLLAQMVQAARDLGRSKPWVTQICSGSRSEQVGGQGGQLPCSPWEPYFPSHQSPSSSLLPSVAQDAPAFLYPCLPPILSCVLSVWSSPYSVQVTLPISLILPARLCYPPLLSLIHSLNKHL